MKTHLRGCRAEAQEPCFCEVRRYGKVAIIATAILLIEVVGGILSGSLALLSDAAHVAADLSAVIVAMAVAYFASRDPEGETKARSKGAIFHAVLLLLAGSWIIHEASVRLASGNYEVQSVPMLAVAFLGLLGNIWQHRELSKTERNVTSQGLDWHVLTDLWQSVAVIVCGITIHFTSITVIDPIVSVLLGCLFIFWSTRLFRMRKNSKDVAGGHCHHHHHHHH